MSPQHRGKSGDPRKAGGAIAGPGGPLDKNAVIVDTSNAILMQEVMVVAVEPYQNGEPQDAILGMTLAGRINKTPDQTSILYLFDADGAAAIITELLGLAYRMGPEFEELFQQRLDAVMKVSRPEGKP